MLRMRMVAYFSFFLILLLLACEPHEGKDTLASASVKRSEQPSARSLFFGTPSDYWYQGKAEVNTYDLQQARYGELHPGEVVLLFVTEDFLTDKQVKNDTYRSEASTPIFKTNKLSRFTTGLYDYSMMSSVFTPTKTDEFPHTLKVSSSVQDWCGQNFAQINYQNGQQWNSQLRSYFEQEGDQDQLVEAAWLEDELMNRLRIDPSALPLGEQQVLPALWYLQLMHKPFESVAAKASLADYTGTEFEGEQLQQYSLSYPSLDRELLIVFEAAAPYKILGWLDSYPSRGQQLQSVAKLRKSELLPYWEMNSPDLASERAGFGL